MTTALTALIWLIFGVLATGVLIALGLAIWLAWDHWKWLR